MKVTKQRMEFLNIFNRLGCLNPISGFRISYAIIRIKNVLAREDKKVRELTIRPKEYEEFNNKRNELAKSYARKDPQGNPQQIQIEGHLEWDIPPEDREAFNKEFETLKSEHTEAFEARNKQIEALNNFLSEEVTLDLYEIKKSDIPENITVEQLDVIEPFIVDIDK